MSKSEFEKQILSLSNPLFRMAKSMLQNSDEASDAVQDLNLKLWEKRSDLAAIENLKGFVYRSMRNLCLDVLRKRKQEGVFDEEQDYDSLNPYEQTEQRDMAKRISQLIDKLPELQRSIIRMRDVEEMDIAEIAYVTTISENAVSVNLSRARQKIREQLLKELNR
mgnify:CR=1 FL=1